MRTHLRSMLTGILVSSAATAGDLALQPVIGEPLTGLSAAQVARFQIGKVLYSMPIPIEDGLGPILNKSNCGSCHSNPVGGWGAISVVRFGMEKKGVFSLYPGEVQSLAQSLANSSFCAEIVPADATVVKTRLTNSSMAFGLVEAIPDSQLAAHADEFDIDGDGVSGRVHWVMPLEAPPGSPLRAGRFGWKAQVATVLTFSSDASRNEMGFTNRFSPVENPPNGDFARLTVCDDVADPEDTLDAQGFGFVDKVTDFQRFLAAPPQTPRSGMTGEALFNQIGCVKCHSGQFTTSSDVALEDSIRSKVIRPYSDFLLHDVGLLADGISDGNASEAEMRTPTLWGLRRRDPMLHDGSAAGGSFTPRVTLAIAKHGPFGEGAASAAAFNALSGIDKTRVIKFLDSLGRAEFDFDADNIIDILDFFALRTCLAQGTTNPDDDCAIADIDQNGVVNAIDVDMFVAAWDGEVLDCNDNGVADLRDIALGTSQDSNEDGVPDECVACRADLNGDALVNGIDLSIVLANWGGSGAGDTDQSGVVNGIDLATILAAWGACR
ncbi:MAG: hypothetical protein EXS15_04985 [Phycisphaerales bacterium]|nr:hypothetical protein [Phycisphaerales bacterium]